MIDTTGLPLAKPEPQGKIKARKKRREAAVAALVRAVVCDRDGSCRLAKAEYLAGVLTHECAGAAEWAHLLQRFKTRGMSPEIRHATATSIMLCTSAHLDLDAHRMAIEAVTDRGADGPLRFRAGRRLLVEEIF